MSSGKAEMIAVGDELTSGFRLDTNSQWVAQQLEEHGLHVAYHTTVGDDADNMFAVFQLAIQRSDVIVITGGLGPTADDLTRHVIARVLNRPLELHPMTLDHIRDLFASRNLEMPASNEIQAQFPAGAAVMPNSEGTAPGIAVEEIANQSESGRCSLFALPGVPAEMKQMWSRSVSPALKRRYGIDWTTRHFTLHCFGTGESAIAEMLPDLIDRGRDPLVGITASGATISLRISTRAASPEQCLLKMQPTIDFIRSQLGHLVFGENGQQLEDVVVAQLRQLNWTISVFDFGLHGEVTKRIAWAEHAIPGAEVVTFGEVRRAQPTTKLGEFLRDRTMTGHEIGLAIGPIDRSETAVNAGSSQYDIALRIGNQVRRRRFGYRGHSSWRETRAVKDVLNAVRVWLTEMSTN